MPMIFGFTGAKRARAESRIVIVRQWAAPWSFPFPITKVDTGAKRKACVKLGWFRVGASLVMECAWKLRLVIRWGLIATLRALCSYGKMNLTARRGGGFVKLLRRLTGLQMKLLVALSVPRAAKTKSSGKWNVQYSR
jgi:hypothetical protein